MEPDWNEVVATAEVAYSEGDVERCVGLFTAGAIVVWNNKLVATGTEEIREFHRRLLPGPLDLRKRLVLALGSRLVVQWRASWSTGPDSGVEQAALEVWEMTPEGLLSRWEAIERRRNVTGHLRSADEL